MQVLWVRALGFEDDQGSICCRDRVRFSALWGLLRIENYDTSLNPKPSSKQQQRIEMVDPL